MLIPCPACAVTHCSPAEQPLLGDTRKKHHVPCVTQVGKALLWGQQHPTPCSEANGSCLGMRARGKGCSLACLLPALAALPAPSLHFPIRPRIAFDIKRNILFPSPVSSSPVFPPRLPWPFSPSCGGRQGVTGCWWLRCHHSLPLAVGPCSSALWFEGVVCHGSAGLEVLVGMDPFNPVFAVLAGTCCHPLPQSHMVTTAR